MSEAPPRQLGPSAFCRETRGSFEAMMMMQAIIDAGGTVVAVVPQGDRREVYAVFQSPPEGYYKAVDDAFAEVLNGRRKK